MSNGKTRPSEFTKVLTVCFSNRKATPVSGVLSPTLWLLLLPASNVWLATNYCFSANCFNNPDCHCIQEGHSITEDWILATSQNCPEGYVRGHPRNAKENAKLREAIIIEGGMQAIIMNPTTVSSTQMEAT